MNNSTQSLREDINTINKMLDVLEIRQEGLMESLEECLREKEELEKSLKGLQKDAISALTPAEREEANKNLLKCIEKIQLINDEIANIESQFAKSAKFTLAKEKELSDKEKELRKEIIMDKLDKGKSALRSVGTFIRDSAKITLDTGSAIYRGCRAHVDHARDNIKEKGIIAIDSLKDNIDATIAKGNEILLYVDRVANKRINAQLERYNSKYINNEKTRNEVRVDINKRIQMAKIQSKMEIDKLQKQLDNGYKAYKEKQEKNHGFMNKIRNKLHLPQKPYEATREYASLNKKISKLNLEVAREKAVLESKVKQKMDKFDRKAKNIAEHGDKRAGELEKNEKDIQRRFDRRDEMSVNMEDRMNGQMLDSIGKDDLHNKQADRVKTINDRTDELQEKTEAEIKDRHVNVAWDKNTDGHGGSDGEPGADVKNLQNVNVTWNNKDDDPGFGDLDDFDDR